MSFTQNMQTSATLEHLFHGMLLPNKAMQILLNQGQKNLSKNSLAFQEKIQKIIAVLKKYNPKIFSLKAYPKEDVFLDTPLVAPVGGKEIVLDWTTAYLLIDAKLGGINGLSIEKRRHKNYSELEKKILWPLFKELAALLTSDPLSPLEEEVKSPEDLCFFMLQTPQATGFIGLPAIFFKINHSPLFSLDFLSRHLSFSLESLCYQQKISFAQALKMKKGTFLPLTSPMEITLSCEGNPLGKACLNLSEEEVL